MEEAIISMSMIVEEKVVVGQILKDPHDFVCVWFVLDSSLAVRRLQELLILIVFAE